MKPGYSDRLFFLVYNIFNIFESIIYCYKSVCFLKKKFLASLSKKKKQKKTERKKAEKLAYQTYSPCCQKLAEAKLQRLLFCGVNTLHFTRLCFLLGLLTWKVF